MGIVKCFQVKVGQDVGVVYQKWLVAIKEWARLQNAATGVKQKFALITDVDVEAESVLIIEKLNNFVPEMEKS